MKKMLIKRYLILEQHLISQYEVGDGLKHHPFIVSSGRINVVDIDHELVCKA